MDPHDLSESYVFRRLFSGALFLQVIVALCPFVPGYPLRFVLFVNGC